MDHVDVLNAFVDDNDRNVVDGLFEIASAIRYLADILGAAPLIDMNHALDGIASAIAEISKPENRK